MKKSEMVKYVLDRVCGSFELDENDISEFIDLMTQAGMKPPSIKASKTRPLDYRWGIGCTMRCDCDECNPNYPVNVWEEE